MNKEEKLGARGEGREGGAGEGVKKGAPSVPSKFFKVGGNFATHHFISLKSCEVKTLK